MAAVCTPCRASISARVVASSGIGSQPMKDMGPTAGGVVGAGRHRREAGGVVALEPHRLRRQRVEGGRPDLSLAVGPEMVLPERVRDDPYDVHPDGSSLLT